MTLCKKIAVKRRAKFVPMPIHIEKAAKQVLKNLAPAMKYLSAADAHEITNTMRSTVINFATSRHASLHDLKHKLQQLTPEQLGETGIKRRCNVKRPKAKPTL